MMEISEVVNTQLAFPGLIVGLVLICAALVFVFGFKSVEDFPFDKLATVADDRKPAGKKRKVKDKKSQSNGQATAVSETKQKPSESAGKTKQVEKSPAKDAPKATTKQEKKQGKTETVPTKAALKDTKNIKEVNKPVEDGQKQGKAKDSAGKQQKEQQSNKQVKSKGKENVEVKNKKNSEKSKNKSEEKPKDFDEGEWEQAFSRKDKKNRKPATSDEDNMAEKSVKTEAASPGKKKKVKSAVEPAAPADPEPTPTPPPAVTPAVEEAPEPVKEVKEKPAKKEKEKEQKKEKPKPADEVAPPETPSVDSEGEGKAAKKKKKKPAAKEGADAATSTVVENKPAVEEPVPSKPKPAEPKPAEEPEAGNGAVFDELGDARDIRQLHIFYNYRKPYNRTNPYSSTDFTNVSFNENFGRTLTVTDNDIQLRTGDSIFYWLLLITKEWERITLHKLNFWIKFDQIAWEGVPEPFAESYYRDYDNYRDEL